MNGIKEDMTMKKMNYSIRIMASLLIAATAMTACSKEESATEDPIEVQQEKQGYTITLIASKGGDISTKALTQDGKKLIASWDEGEKVKAMQKGEEGWKTLGILESAASSDASTTLTGTFDKAPDTSKDIVLFLHPYDRNDLSYDEQEGTLESLMEHGDYAKATLLFNSFEIEGNAVKVEEGTNIEFSALQAIVKFTFKDKKGNDLNIHTLTIHDNGGIMRSKTNRESGEDYENGDITITRSGSEESNVMYVAICNAFTSSELVLTGKTGDDLNNYTYSSRSYTRTSPNFEHGYFYDITVKMERDIDLTGVSRSYEAQDGDVLTGEIGYSNLTIADGATVTLRNVITGTNTSDETNWAGITCLGDATLILEGENDVKGFMKGYAGISVAAEHTLTIKGEGTLEVNAFHDQSGDGSGAGIGGDADSTCGNIVIEGGTITADGGYYAPGIGSGASGTCGNITISGGTVVSTGNYLAAGIGCGRFGTCGDITITDGVTKVTANKGNQTGGDPAMSGYGYCIGAGQSYGEKISKCGTITIGGVVKGQEYFYYMYSYTYPESTDSGE